MYNKPKWLKVKLEYNDTFYDVKKILREKKLYTVCEEAKCPNISECWSHGTATIMVLGDTCTRGCKFCAVKTGNPKGWIDPLEPLHVVETIRHLNLRYVVLTMVDRDDLLDGGAFHIYRVIKEIRRNFPDIKIEALVGDFKGNKNSIETIANSSIDVFAHNVETVERLTPIVRDPRASYKQSLFVLEYAKKVNPNILTKSSIMVGLGETEEEVIQTMKHLRSVGVDIITIGQYLQPTKRHLAVVEYVPPYKFKWYRDRALELGFIEAFCGPLVRSSYRAEKVFYGEV